MREVLNMKRRAKDNMFQCSEYTKWCPNPQCGRVIKVNNPEQAFPPSVIWSKQISQNSEEIHSKSSP
jgi:hypothetical protein